nr:MAG TPA: Baseplate wedge protein [Caudoviricetes sp.]
MIPKNSIIDLDIKDSQPSYTYKLNEESKHIVGNIDKLEALKQSIYLMLSTERYYWLIYNWYYGIELDNLIGQNKDYVVSEIPRRIKECLIEDDRILDINDFKLDINKDTLCVTFVVESIFGNVSVRKEIRL